MLRKVVPDVIKEPKLVRVHARTTVQAAAKLMRQNDVGAVLIMRGEKLKGILTLNDIAYRVVAEGLDPEATFVSSVMTPDPDTISPNTTAIDALRLMQDGGYRHIPVEENRCVLAVVSRRDFFGVEKARLDDETTLWEHIA